MKQIKEEKKSSSARALDHLLNELLFTDRYGEGGHVVEYEIAQALGCSRAPVREAIKELVSMGLLVSEPNRGTFVASISESEMEEIFSIRCLLEGRILEILIMDDMLTPEDYAQLEQLTESMIEAARGEGTFSEKIATITRLDIRFHSFIWNRSSQSQSRDILMSLYYKLFLAMTRDYYATSDLGREVSLHYDIIRYLKKGHVAKCREALRNHIGVFQQPGA